MRKLLFKLIKLSGLPFVFREFFQRNKVTILLFHDIKEETARKTFTYLCKKYKIISLSDFVDKVNGKDNIVIPPKALIITFDDGYIGNYEILSEIKKHNIPITIFLCSGIINTNRHYWFKYKHPDISFSRLTNISNKKKLDILNKVGFSQTRNFENPQALNKKYILKMKDFINFQSHTLFHPILPKCSDTEAKDEIFNSKKVLEDNYNFYINAISYPNGDYSDRDINICKKAGYTCGLTVDYGFNSFNTDLFRLKRISVNDTDNIDELIVKASGVWAFFKTRNGRKCEFGYTNKVTEG